MKINFKSKIRLLLATFIGVFSQVAFGQAITGTRTVCTSGCDYPTIAAAVSALNTNGVGTGGVTINIAAGHIENLTSGLILSATGTATNPIVFRKNGVGTNPLLVAYTGTRLASALDSIDVMWSFEGSDFITLDGINFSENSGNVTPTSMMEVGIGFYKRSVTDGANNNLITNCVITLNRDNITASAGSRANATGSIGIEFVSATRNNIGTVLVPTAVSGASSFNRIYANTIQNCNFGISLIGAAVASPYTLADLNNDIGGTAGNTGNTIVNFGGGLNPVSACGAMFIHNQWSYNISNNVINNNNGAGINHSTSNRGIWLFASSIGSSGDIKKNRITITAGSSTTAITWCLDFEAAQSGANGNTINIDSNEFLNCSQTVATTAEFTAIWLNTAATNVNVRGNIVRGFRYSGTGTSVPISNRLACPNLNILNNIVDSVILDGATASGTHYNIGITGTPSATLNVNNNITRRTFLNTTGTGTKTINSIYYTGATPINNFIGNTVDSIIRNGTTGGSTVGIVQAGGTNGTSTTTIRRNNVSNIFITGTGSSSLIYGIQASTGTIIIDSNNVSNLGCLKSTGVSVLYGIYDGSAPNNERYNNNNINNITNLGTGTTYGLYSWSVAGVKTIGYNIVHTINAAGLTSAGIVTQSSTPTVTNNKVYNINYSGTGSATVSGILVISSSSGAGSITNNLVGDLKAPSANAATPTTAPTIRGINITNTTATTSYDVAHNTVYLDATSSGTNFGTTALFHTNSTVATTSNLILRNNVLINNSTANGTGRTVAYHRSATGLVNFDNNSNRNIFYAGTPSTTNLIFFDGTNADQTLTDYQLRVIPRDSASFTENVAFVSTVGSSASYLKINPTTPTFAESGSLRLANVSIDYANVIRGGFTGYVGTGGLPDIGAWEDNLTGQPVNSMYFDTVTAEQTSITVPTASINNVVIRIPIMVQRGANALSVTSFNLSTLGTTSAADISQAKIFYTGNSTTFNNSQLVGSLNTPSGAFNITTNVQLAGGINYFWLTYDVSGTATAGNQLDATLNSVVVSGVTYTPIVSNPNGALTIQPRLNGNYNVGVGQTFTTITQAVNTLNQLGVTGPVNFILKDPQYDINTGETFPIVFGPYTNMSPTNRVRLYPDVNISALVVGNSAVATFDFNNCSHIEIDGRQGATGSFVSGSNLIISSTNNTSPAIRFINDADSNQIIYTELRSSNVTVLGSAGAGVINFGTTIFANGNDFNTIKFCDIREEGSGFPVAAISSLGSGTTVATNNDFNTIDSCNIYNFFSPTVASAAIYIGANNSAWNFRGNKFYQTAARTFTAAATQRVFWVTPNVANLVSASGFIIHNNYIGGNSAAGTGLYELNGAFAHNLNVFDISVGLGAVTSLQGNIITNINYNTLSTGSTAFLGINAVNGNVDIGTVNGNIIGSRTVNGAITVTSASTTTFGAMGIRNGGGTGNTFNIRNNIINGIDLVGTGATTTPEFFGINAFNGTNVNITNNLIGDTIPTNASIRIFSAATSGTSVQRVSGIFANPSGGTPTQVISNNVISNIFNGHSVAGSHTTATRGIFLNPTVTGSYLVSNNLITNIYSSGRTTATGANTVIGGLVVTSTLGTFDVRQNIIGGLHLTSSSVVDAAQNTGIFFSTPSSGTHHLIRNVIHTQSAWFNNPFAVINGIEIAAGNNNVNNNIIRMGFDSLGNAYPVGLTLRGITKNSGNSNIYFNTVYIGGANTNAGVGFSTAFQRSGAGVDSVLNNIFTNVRTNGTTGNPGHFAMFLNNNTTLHCDYNLLFADTIGRINNISYTNISSWKVGSLEDGNSVSNAISFINPTGSASTFNLRINPTTPTPLEAGGIAVTGIGTDVDFDGQLRSSLTPVDLGADAGNFTPLDLAPPTITYTTLINTINTTNRTITATISDVSGIYTTGTLTPRIYFKKMAVGAFQSSQGVLTSGNGFNGTWTFTIDHALLGGVVGDDSIYYFIAAQDSSSSNNVGSTPAGIEATSITNITVFPAFNAYKIIGLINGIINVGTGQPFTNLTGNNGVFAYINTSVVSGDITIRITSDIEETGLVGLNETAEAGVGNYKINIVPDAAVLRNITGTYNVNSAGLIRLSGADRVKIDGSFANSGRFLRFMNRALAGATLNLLDDADNDTIANCIIEGVNNTVGMLNFLGSTKVGGTGNDSNAVIGCLFRDTVGNTVATGMPNTCMFSQGALSNDFNTFDNNELYNFGFNGVNLSSTSGNFWKITNNKVYQILTRNAGMTIFQIDGGSGHEINNNSIGGAAPNRSGVAFQTTSTLTGISLASSVTTTFPININNNILSNMAISGTGTSALICIRVSGGNVLVSGNTLGGNMMPYDTLKNNGDNGAISILGGNNVTVENNLISNLSYYNGSIYRNSGIHIGTTTPTSIIISNNTIQNISGNSTGTNTSVFRVAGITVSAAPNTGLVITQNNIRNIYNFNSGTVAYATAGIFHNAGSTTSPVITRNRIRNIGSIGAGTGTSSPEVMGIQIGLATNAVVANNQISIGDSAFNQTRVYGIFDGTSGTNTYAYNSIFINGTSSSGANNSTGFHRTSTTSNINFRNNLVYNRRISLGTGFNYAVSSASLTGVTGNNINYNMFFVNDTSRIAEIPSGTANGWTALNSLFVNTYNTNWAELNSAVAPHDLFIDTLLGNLGIVTTSPAAWYVNGKGIRIPSISADYGSILASRSTSIAGGATDIGSIEFTPTSTPPPAFADKTPVSGDSTQFFFASRLVGKAVWGAAGTLPSSVNFQYYSGVTPPNSSTGLSVANAYYQLQANGGNGYTLNLSLMQDSAVHGNLNSVPRMQLANYTGTANNWVRFSGVSSTVNGQVTAFGVTNPGIFTFTDSLTNPLPVTLNRFTAKLAGDDVILDWQTATEKNNRGFYVQRSADGKTFEEVRFVRGKENTTTTTNYTLTDINPFTQTQVLYYRLKQVDFNGDFTYSPVAIVNKNNLGLTSVTVYPNPMTETLNITFNTEESTATQIEVLDLQGRVLFTQEVETVRGYNKIQVEQMASLTAGVYYAKITMGGETQTIKIVKQ
ncbi:MAG: T9SS type A sorting domain-containing protein [Bacteroidia bacterium]|nr:T9SS type A sorting domain-containing protein [Bacteroidia bacterium]